MALTNGSTKGFVMIWVDIILHHFPNIFIFLLFLFSPYFYFPPNIPLFVCCFTFFLCCHNKGTLLLELETQQKMLCMWTAACTFVNSIASISHCFFPAVSTAGNEFSAEIIQLQLPKCLILSFILILVCLLQPWQEMDVAALRFVQITK